MSDDQGGDAPELGPDRGDVPADPFGEAVAGISGSAVSSTWAWLTLGGGLVVIGAVVAAGLVTPALLLDIVAAWPVAALGLIAVPFAIAFRDRWPVLVAVVPLLFLTWLLFGVGWFLTDDLADPPSRAADITGPDSSPDLATFTIETDGLLAIDTVVGVDYRIATARSGGDTGPPEVYESSGTGRLDALARPRDDVGWYDSAGWRLGLRAGPAWTLDLTAAEIDADLATLTIPSLTIAADGTVRLGRGVGNVSVTAGTLTLVVPDGMSADGFELEVASGADVTVVEEDE